MNSAFAAQAASPTMIIGVGRLAIWKIGEIVYCSVT
jgi:hypothetical protein